MRALALVALLFAGCGGSPWFRPHAFVPPLRHYRVRYDEPASRTVLPSTWRVLNFRGGVIDDDAAWIARVTVDEGGGPRRVLVPTFDLYAEHERDGTVIFAMTLPLPPEQDRRDLSILADDFASGALGEGGLSVVRTRRGEMTEEQLAVTRTIERSTARVGGAEGYFVSVERGVVGSGRSVILTFILVRPHRWRFRHEGLTSTTSGAPMVIVFGYLARSDRYPDHLADFEAMLHRIDVRPEPE
jgi:hypothetical protein